VPVSGAEDHPIPDEYVYCTVCHGTLFKGNVATRAPKLTGLSAWYIEKQLNNFKAGMRGTHADDSAGHEMRQMTERLTAKQMLDAVRLVTSLPRQPATSASQTGDIDRGRTLFATCAACHGDQAEGKETLGAPNLASQNAWYLAKQLNDFTQDKRGTHPSDHMGRQMRLSVTNIASERDIDDLVAFIQQLDSN